MRKSRLLEIMRDREKVYVEKTEQAIEMFLPTLKKGMELAFFDSQEIELYVLDIFIVPTNFRFMRIEGKFITVSLGDKIKIDDNLVEVDMENLWDFAKPFSVMIPASLLESGEAGDIAEYLIKVRENNDKIPAEILKENTSNVNTVKKEFKKIDKELDEAQLFALKYFKSPSIH